ncbi:hypothetical protein [Streptomyces djakartensis]|uniref:hypothetical protein n=1 Tax=Streptomyces djakartensis TaxID=68193 RepID=UPI00167EEAF2|nr:hypothetical protein [Streptomyces djakartensis]
MRTCRPDMPYLALTATFARRRSLRREVRSTPAVLVPGRPVESQQVDREPVGPAADGGAAPGDRL